MICDKKKAISFSFALFEFIFLIDLIWLIWFDLIDYFWLFPNIPDIRFPTQPKNEEFVVWWGVCCCVFESAIEFEFRFCIIKVADGTKPNSFKVDWKSSTLKTREGYVHLSSYRFNPSVRFYFGFFFSTPNLSTFVALKR